MIIDHLWGLSHLLLGCLESEAFRLAVFASLTCYPDLGHGSTVWIYVECFLI